MENYKKAIKTRRGVLIILALIAVGLGVYNTFWASPEVKDNPTFSFICGLIVAGGLLALLKIMQYSKVLHNDTNLKIEFNKENDERRKAIRAKAGMPVLLITSVLMIVSGIIAGYFNTVVFWTLVTAALCQMVIGCVIKLIYMKKM